MNMPSHLRMAHHMTVAKYKELYPDEKFNTKENVFTMHVCEFTTAPRYRVPGQVPYYR